jgi:hypothetical protein
MKFRLLPVAATAMLALSACTGGGGGSAAPSPTHGPVPQALVDAARCMRDNGYPDWPDPVRYEDGHWGWPDSAPEVHGAPECENLMRQGKAAQVPSRRPVSAAEMAQLRQWADCMRTHGIPDWPDPDSNGQFDPPVRLKPLESNPDLDAANRACVSLEPADGIALKAGTGPSKPAG